MFACFMHKIFRILEHYLLSPQNLKILEKFKNVKSNLQDLNGRLQAPKNRAHDHQRKAGLAFLKPRSCMWVGGEYMRDGQEQGGVRGELIF